MSTVSPAGAVRPRSTDLMDAVLDPGTFRSWDRPVGVPDPVASDGYRAELATARDLSGADEAVRTGEGLLQGIRVGVLCSEFDFLAGTAGSGTVARLVAAVERATAERLPLLAATASGGTRMQEGNLAFLGMAAIAAALTAHKAAGLPYLVYLRHPTTGGTFASWGSLGHFTVAEPGALVGFLGPRAYRGLHSTAFPRGVQTAENLRAHGLVDAVLPVEHLRPVAGRALAMLAAAGAAPAPDRVGTAPAAGPVAAEPDAWTTITRSRRPGRPGVRALLRAAADALPFTGTGAGEPGHGLVLALARFGTTTCLLAGQDRAVLARTPLGPDALRAARRGMRLAAELRVPLVTVIDTPGAALTPDAEEGGLAGEIARCLGELVALPVPTVSVLLGQGAGGAALALLPADRVLAARHAWLMPLPPEGASAIVHGSPARAAEVAGEQHVRSGDLLRAGAVDVVVEELPDAADEPRAFVRRVAAALEDELAALLRTPDAERRARRERRYRAPGPP